MRQQFNIFCFAILILSATFSLEAVPAYPHPIVVTQPDGSTITVRLRGDENRKITTTVDGYVVKKNKQGIYTYALQDGTKRFIPSETIARDPEKRNVIEQVYVSKIKTINEIAPASKGASKIKRAPSAARTSAEFPTTGAVKSLVIMVNFSDVSFVTPNPHDAFTNLLNQPNYSDNGGTGSVKDYFQASSNGQFNPQFDVVGPYTLPNPMAYYGANDPESEDDVKPTHMIVDACKAANDAGLDFAQYDTDNDGYIDNVFVYYAGYNEAEGGPENSIWPHRWVVQSRDFGYNESLLTFDNKRVFDYACTSELKGSSGANMCGIGTFTHEFGHVLGLPDYYHTETVEDKNTLNDWSIMDGGAYLNKGRTPPAYSAYDRFYLGWLTPQELKTAADVSLYPLSQSKTPLASTDKQAYLLSSTTHNLVGDNPSPKEFYIMEYRKKTGWDTYIPEEGLLFWHIDYDQGSWNDNSPNNYSGTTQTNSSHMRVYLQPLSGSSTTPGTAFKNGAFNPMKWSGSSMNRAITAISKTADSISFKIMGGAPVLDPGTNPKIQIGIVNESLQFSEINVGTESVKQLKIKTTSLTENLGVVVSGANTAMFTVSTQTIAKSEANSELGADLFITYNPNSSGTHTAILTISGGGLNPDKVIELRGKAN